MGARTGPGQDPDSRGMDVVLESMVELAKVIGHEVLHTFVAHG